MADEHRQMKKIATVQAQTIKLTNSKYEASAPLNLTNRKSQILSYPLLASRVRATPSTAMPAICLDENIGDSMEDINPEDDVEDPNS
jgi:hypothetical protein